MAPALRLSYLPFRAMAETTRFMRPGFRVYGFMWVTLNPKPQCQDSAVVGFRVATVYDFD